MPIIIPSTCLRYIILHIVQRMPWIEAILETGTPVKHQEKAKEQMMKRLFGQWSKDAYHSREVQEPELMGLSKHVCGW